MNISPVVSYPQAGHAASRLSGIARMNRRTALRIAFALWALAAIGDYVTTAEVGFTLLYLIPIGIAVWWRGIRPGLLLCALCTASFLITWIDTTKVRADPLSRYLIILAWNLVGEVGVFLAFALVLHGLRQRLDLEVSERQSAVVQLRHSDRLNTLGKLASGIAHELGTPLNVVAGRASLIASRRILGDEACESAEIILQQTERMTAIIKNLLAFARRGGTRKASLDLTRIVRETVLLLGPLTKSKGVEIVLESGPPLVAPVNAGELQQVLTNLIMNGAQAMPTGGRVHVTVEEGARNRSGDRAERGAKDVALIRVRDEGTGIAPDVLPHIFDPFFTTKDVGAGTGLGLSVTFGIVRDHGGAIDVSTKLGEGTEFVVSLPRAEGTERPASWLSQRISKPGSRRGDDGGAP